MPAKTIWSYQENFDFTRDIESSHDFFIPLDAHRGDYSREAILNIYSVDATGRMHTGAKAAKNTVTLFGGHIGSGKSTELRDYAALLKHSYTVSLIETTKMLDINNLKFSDLLIALTAELMKAFENQHLSLQPDSIFVKPITDWFETRILKVEKFKDLETELRTEASAAAGIPFLAKLTAKMSAKFRGGVSYKEELRHEIQNGFSQLLIHFNALIEHANELLTHQNHGPLLFIFDGTDKLSKENADTFFKSDINQLAQIQTNMIICTPMTILLEAGSTTQRFKTAHLPMIKIFDKNEIPIPENEDVLIQLVVKRLPLAYFDHLDTIRYLVQSSGGHVRDLIRLVSACFSRLKSEQITKPIAEQAVKDIATTYLRQVLADDWQEIVKIDLSLGDEIDRTETRLRLLYDLVLLEYNNFWWRSHPLIRTLPAYTKAMEVFKTKQKNPLASV
jgi:energy-coupling factor transporter ATP-binding protein EcfA2